MENLSLTLIALFQAITAIAATVGIWINYKGTKAAEKTLVVAVKTQEIAQKTEANSNSMKDALVAAEKSLSYAAGVKEGAKP